MPERNAETTMTRRPGQLNESQQTRLRITCQYIDKLLSDIEDILHSATSQSPFPRYVVDINPAQIRVIEDHIRRLRSQLVRTIAWQQMRPTAAGYSGHAGGPVQPKLCGYRDRRTEAPIHARLWGCS